jgi:hypothetical protein
MQVIAFKIKGLELEASAETEPAFQFLNKMEARSSGALDSPKHICDRELERAGKRLEHPQPCLASSILQL